MHGIGRHFYIIDIQFLLHLCILSDRQPYLNRELKSVPLFLSVSGKLAHPIHWSYQYWLLLTDKTNNEYKKTQCSLIKLREDSKNH